MGVDKHQVYSWMTDESIQTLKNGYLLPGETLKDAFNRVANSVASFLKKPELSSLFLEAMEKNWLCLASPVLSNSGSERGLPISCNSIHIGDSVSSIFKKNTELAMLSKGGAGVGIYVGDIRGRGSKIAGNGVGEGVIPWVKCLEQTTLSVSQGSTRRGTAACYLPIEHQDYDEFIQIRRATGDINKRARTMNIGACISDKFMNDMLNGNIENRKLWQETLKERVENGEPYMLFTDNVNNANPECYKNKNLIVKTSNICNEIVLHTDSEHTFVCCLSSLNLARYDEWKSYVFSNGMTLPELSIWFLDGVLEEYIQKAAGKEGFECSIRSAIKGRALGLGVLGFHTYLQMRMLDIESFEASMINAEIFKFIREEAEKATYSLFLEYGVPAWCVGSKRRNTHLIALAPTANNSIISGGVSAGIEPISSNVIAIKSAKGTFIRYNTELKSLLAKKNKDTTEVWADIIKATGSVQHLTFLTEEERGVFKTARELNQHTLIKLAAQRQRYVDQSQSLNLFFPSNASAKYIHEVHLAAWQSGLKGLYYLRSESALTGDVSYKSQSDCVACES
jgi:ribonucleoside-diphosphate reductase alpha chain